jgi:hypothetical protein
VNRCLTEGRQAFLREVAGIEGGIECERFAPVLSALADGEASAADLVMLRPHMRTCLACRVRLKEFRATPARVAALVPPVALVALETGGGLRDLLESLAGAAQQKAAAMGDRFHAAAELATGQKVAAVAASAAAVAGGGGAVDQLANHSGPPRPQPAHQKAERQQPGRVEVWPEQRHEQCRQVRAGCHGEGEADEDRDVESPSCEDRGDARRHADADRRNPRNPDLVGLGCTAAADHARPHVVSDRTGRGDHEAGYHRVGADLFLAIAVAFATILGAFSTAKLLRH